MKLLLRLGLFVFTVASAQAAPLVTAVMNPGFVANPQKKTFHLERSGRMQLEIHDFRSGRDSVKDLGQLSRAAMADIQKDLNSIGNASLVDGDEGKPLCTDIPSYSVKAKVGDRELELRRIAECHTWNLNSPMGQGRLVADLAVAFLGF